MMDHKELHQKSLREIGKLKLKIAALEATDHNVIMKYIRESHNALDKVMLYVEENRDCGPIGLPMELAGRYDVKVGTTEWVILAYMEAMRNDLENRPKANVELVQTTSVDVPDEFAELGNATTKLVHNIEEAIGESIAQYVKLNPTANILRQNDPDPVKQTLLEVYDQQKLIIQVKRDGMGYVMTQIWLHELKTKA